jgi:hypothetical protein
MDATRETSQIPPNVDHPLEHGMTGAKIKETRRTAREVAKAACTLAKCMDNLATIISKLTWETMASGTIAHYGG